MANLIYQRLNELGFTSVTQLFEHHAGEPIWKVLRTIAHSVPNKNYLDIPIMALKLAYEHEMTDQGKQRQFALDTLQRSLVEYLGKGWMVGKNWQKRHSNAHIHWHIPSEHFQKLELIWKVIERTAPKGWKPNTVNDEILLNAFAEVWPE